MGEWCSLMWIRNLSIENFCCKTKTIFSTEIKTFSSFNRAALKWHPWCQMEVERSNSWTRPLSNGVSWYHSTSCMEVEWKIVWIQPPFWRSNPIGSGEKKLSLLIGFNLHLEVEIWLFDLVQPFYLIWLFDRGGLTPMLSV